jgi:hypothetical protein
LIVPTIPLALSRRSSVTSRLTQVDRAMPRIEPATEPPSVRATRTQNHTLVRLSSVPASTSTKSAVARPNVTTEIAVARSMAVCLRLRSTKVPKAGPMNAIARLYAAPMTAVATTERVSR